MPQMLPFKESSVNSVSQMTISKEKTEKNPEEDRFWSPLPNDGWKKDWAKTASHIKAMKGVITVDTATAHLAGALGVKCIVLMPKKEFTCWRWKHGRWYDSIVTVAEDDYDQIPDLIRRM